MAGKLDTKLSKVEQLLKELKEDINKKPPIGNSTKVEHKLTDEAIDELTDKVTVKVIDKIRKEGFGTKIILPPPKYILEKFQEQEIRRWEDKLKKLDEDHLRIGAFVIALDRQTNRKEIISAVFGSQYTSGDAYGKYTKLIDDLVEVLIIRADSQKRICPNIEAVVRESLKTYRADEEKIKNVIDRITRIFIEKIEKVPS